MRLAPPYFQPNAAFIDAAAAATATNDAAFIDAAAVVLQRPANPHNAFAF